MRKKSFILVFMLICFLSFSKTIEIKMSPSPAGTDNYIKLLLEKSFEELGYKDKVTFGIGKAGFGNGFEALAANDINLFYSGNKDGEKGDVYLVNIPLTNNLLGTRLIFIPKGDAALYENIYTLEDLKKSGKVGGFGKGWADAGIWKKNGIPYFEKENGNWQAMFTMMAKKTRGIDYFSRGVIEIMPEKAGIIEKNNLALEVEPNLMFKYDLDFFIYLNKKNSELNKAVEAALVYARDSGLITRTVEEYWKKDFEALNVKNRRTILIPN